MKLFDNIVAPLIALVIVGSFIGGIGLMLAHIHQANQPIPTHISGIVTDVQILNSNFSSCGRTIVKFKDGRTIPFYCTYYGDSGLLKIGSFNDILYNKRSNKITEVLHTK